jgi:hypothetical protein
MDLFVVTLHMAHKWPSIYDLSLGQHLVWKFLWKDDDHIKLMVETLPLHNEHLLNIRYAPVLACFDVEYWHTMDLSDSIPDLKLALKVRKKKKYMQNLRHALVRSMCSAEPNSMIDGSWDMSDLHHWSIRTWNKHAHTIFGRSQYLGLCKQSSKTPYTQQLSMRRM